MAGSVNKVILVGNLGRDPETRQTQDGRPIVNMSVATSENWRDRQTGERRERTEWHRVVIFNERLAEVAQNYLRKGSKVYLEGQLQNAQVDRPVGAGALHHGRSCSAVFAASSPCWTAARTAAAADATTAASRPAPRRLPATAALHPPTWTTTSRSESSVAVPAGRRHRAT